MENSIYESRVKGIICLSCIDILVSKLNSKRGIIKVSSSYIKSSVSIEYDSNIISKEEIISFLNEIEYSPYDKAISSIWFDIITLMLIILLFCFIKFVPLPSTPKTDNNTSYLSLFLIGLVTSTHCIFMCGGIMISSAKIKALDFKKNTIKNSIYYNISRVLSYSLLGLIFGLIGKYLLFSVKVKSIIYIFTSIYIIFSGMSLLGLPIARKIEYALPSLCKIKKYNKNFGPLFAGLFTALMPCGASNTIFLLAVSSGNALNGFLSLLSWSLGTVPLMMFFPLISLIFKKKEGVLIRINVIFLITLGLNMLIMGLKLIM